VSAYENDDDEPGLSRWVSLEDIRNQDHNLSIPLYLREKPTEVTQSQKPQVSLADSITAWEASSRNLRQAVSELLDIFDSQDHEPATEPRKRVRQR